MFRTKCGWCREKFNLGDETALRDEKLFHISCLNLYVLYCRDILTRAFG